ncbi:MAG: hypothetical protein KF713_06410 [Turneriella sp.]|nr:hypothetical protein [Turneriella sp.]
MRAKYFVLLLILNLIYCKKSSIFTEIDASFKSLDDVFIAEFKNQPKQVEKNTELTLEAKEAKTGHFGTLLSIDVWEFADDAQAKQGYETLAGAERQNAPREYDQTKAGEYRYTFVRSTGIAGEIFTAKKILFRILGENKDTIREYLVASKLGRIR